MSNYVLEKRMALTKEHLLRAKEPMDDIEEEIYQLTTEAEKRGLEWSMVDITLRIIDSRYIKAVEEFSKPIQEGF